MSEKWRNRIYDKYITNGFQNSHGENNSNFEKEYFPRILP